MACVCIQELPDEKADNRFSLSQPCPVQNTVIVSLCDCQEDTMSQMEVRRAHRKGRMVPLRPEVWRGRGGQVDPHELGSNISGLDGDGLYGLWSPTTW